MGDYPRHIQIDPSGAFMYACNQRSDNITSFRVDRKTGSLTFTGHYTAVGSPACIIFLARTARLRSELVNFFDLAGVVCGWKAAEAHLPTSIAGVLRLLAHKPADYAKIARRCFAQDDGFVGGG